MIMLDPRVSENRPFGVQWHPGKENLANCFAEDLILSTKEYISSNSNNFSSSIGGNSSSSVSSVEQWCVPRQYQDKVEVRARQNQDDAPRLN